MDKLKQWMALTLVAVLAVGAAGWFLLISPKRAQASDLKAQTASAQTGNDVLRVKIEELKAKAKDLPRQTAKLAAVAAKIPDNPALPALIRSLSKAADSADVELVSMAPGQPAPVAAPVAAAATPTAGAAGVTPTKASPAVSATAGTLESITLNINVVGGYFQVEQFLDQLEHLTRSFKVNGLTVAPGLNPIKPTAGQSTVDTGSSLSAVISGAVFLSTGRAPIPTSVK